MMEQDLIDSSSLRSFPSFNLAEHNALSSELKQLYDAITNTRQRLWRYKNREEFYNPMLNYWSEQIG